MSAVGSERPYPGFPRERSASKKTVGPAAIEVLLRFCDNSAQKAESRRQPALCSIACEPKRQKFRECVDDVRSSGIDASLREETSWPSHCFMISSARFTQSRSSQCTDTRIPPSLRRPS